MKFKPPGKKTVRTLLASGVAVASVATLVLSQSPAYADAGFKYVAVGSDTIQDFENGWAAALSPGELDSANATNPVTNASHEVITPAKVANNGPTNHLPAEQCSYNRPNGSGDGVIALRASLGSAAAAATGIAGFQTGATTFLATNAPQANCVDIGRSSSDDTGHIDASTGNLVYIPFAVDGVTFSIGSSATTASTSSVPDGCSTASGATNPCVATPATNLPSGLDFSLAELQNLYGGGLWQTDNSGNGCYYPYGTTTAAAQQPGGAIPAGCTALDLYVPQNGSGTLKFWESQLHFASSGLPSWDYQTIQPDLGGNASTPNGVGTPQTAKSFYTAAQATGGTAATQVPSQQDDGTAVTVDPNGLFPFSVAQYISQSNGHSPRFFKAALTPVGGVAPTTGAAPGTLNTGFPITRDVFNVVAYDRVVNTGDGNFDPTLAQLFVTSASTGTAVLCNDKLLIEQYGFALLTSAPLNGLTCGDVNTALDRAYDATTTAPF
jgi:hypothetical protein